MDEKLKLNVWIFSVYTFFLFTVKLIRLLQSFPIKLIVNQLFPLPQLRSNFKLTTRFTPLLSTDSRSVLMINNTKFSQNLLHLNSAQTLDSDTS